MPDLLNETRLSFAAAARIAETHISTVHRWRLRGIQGIRLESIRVGGRRVTSLQALERFFARTTAAIDGEGPRRATSSRQSAIERAERELAEAGI